MRLRWSALKKPRRRKVAVLVRDLDGTIRSSTTGVTDLYGWLPDQTVGQVSHTLLHTQFPQPLDTIQSHLLSHGTWEGELWHIRKDGRAVVVKSRWELRRDASLGLVVIESNRDSTVNIVFSRETFHRVFAGSIVLVMLLVWAMLTKGSARIPERLALVAGLTYAAGWLVYWLLSKKPPRQVGTECALTSAAILVGVAALELPAVTHLIDYRAVFATNMFYPWKSVYYRQDSELLWMHQPYQRMAGVFKRGNMADYACLPDTHGEPFDVRYDGNGFRNERDLSQADVAMIGDSYVEAPYAATSALSSSVLARSLGQTVANLGMSGYGPQQELAVLRRFAAPLHPRTAVWVFFEGNDLEDIGRYHRLHDNWAVERAKAHGWWARSFTKNALLAGGRLMSGCTPSPDYAKRYGVTRDRQGRDVRMYFAEKPAQMAPGHLAALTELQSIFAEAHRLADERGMQLVVAFAPIAYRVYRDVASFDEASEELKSWRLNDLPDRLRGMLAGISPDIRFVDLTPDLNAAARAGRLVYMPDDTHWTADGHAVVGETLAREIGAAVH